MPSESDLSYDTGGVEAAEMAPDNVATDAAPADQRPEPSEADKALVQKLLKTIKADKRHFKKRYDRMHDDMHMAMHGCDKDWPAKNYKAAIVGRHINQKTASIYAKNPKVVARRKEMLDFTVWDETPESLATAMQVMQQAQMATQVAAQSVPPTPEVDPATGQPLPNPAEAAAAAILADPRVQNAKAIIDDVQQGMQRRQMLAKFGKTLELVYADAMRAQTPLDFKSGMKATVRRAATTAAAYVELGFQREYEVPYDVENVLDDCRDRIAHLQKLMQDAAEGEIDDSHAEMAELEDMVANLEAEPQECVRSGLTFRWLQATKVIPDRYCKSYGGFLGARHITVEEVLPKKDAEEKFKVDLGSEYTPYNADGKREGDMRGVDSGDDDPSGVFATDRTEDDMVCVYKMYNKRTGLCYHLCDGHSKFLNEPAPPTVKVPRFWPVYGLTFNQVESETELYGPSDVGLLRDMQNELNRSRQGKREHRQAARPRFVFTNGTFDPDKDLPALETQAPFEMVGLSGDPEVPIEKRLQPFPMPGVDPNLYDTNEVMQDAMLTVGAQAAQLGGVSKSTATEAAIADGAANTSDSSAVDDLDAFLTAMARDGAIICMQEMTKEDVVRIVGPGAIWVEDLGMTVEDIQNEVYLEVEAGSSGKPNQAQEVRNFKELGPLLMQIPGVNPEKFGKEAIRRLDDRMDLNEWIIPGLPAMVAQNRQTQPMQGGDNPAEQDPNQQGEKGGDKAPAPGGPAGTGPAFGSNQT